MVQCRAPGMASGMGDVQWQRVEGKGWHLQQGGHLWPDAGRAPFPDIAQLCPTQPSHNSVSATMCCLAEWPFLDVAWPVPFS